MWLVNATSDKKKTAALSCRETKIHRLNTDRRHPTPPWSVPESLRVDYRSATNTRYQVRNGFYLKHVWQTFSCYLLLS